MSIRSNKERADRLAAAVVAERRARRVHWARAKAIFLRRLGSPGGLALCFGAGAVAGLRLGEDDHRRGADERDGEWPDDAGDKGVLERFSDSPLGNIAVRLAAATIVRYVLISDGGGDGGDAGGDAAADSAAGG